MAERRQHGIFRLPMLENFEERQLMAIDMEFVAPLTQSTSGAVVSSACQPVVATERVSDATKSLDVDRDGRISNLDFLAILNYINQRSTRSLDAFPASPVTAVSPNLEGEAIQNFESLEKMDVNSDGQIAPLDVLLIVDRIQRYNPLTPCTCAACLATDSGIKCESISAAIPAQAGIASVELAPQWQP